MADRDFDLFVIGAGSGGVRASRFSAQLRRPRGRRRGSLSRRHLRERRLHSEEAPRLRLALRTRFEDAQPGYGWTVGESRFDWPTLIANKNAEIERLNGIYERLLDGRRRRPVIEGRARVVDAHTVEVAGQRYSAENILVATGGWPTHAGHPRHRARDHLERALLPRRAAAEGDRSSAAATSRSSSRASSTASAST